MKVNLFRRMVRMGCVSLVLASLILSLVGISPVQPVFAFDSGTSAGGGARGRPTACYSLSLSHHGSGSDPVPTPTKSAKCKLRYSYVAGEKIHLTAAPANGWSVNQWFGTSSDHSLATTNLIIMPALSWEASVVYTNTITLAFLMPLSGPQKNYGISARKGAMLAISQWNANQGVLDRRITAIYKDTRCDAAPAVSVFKQLISQRNIRYVVGEVCSRASIPISEIAEERGVVMISPLSTNPNVTVYPDGTVKDYVFRAGFIDTYQGGAVARYALGKGYTRAYLLYDPGNGLETDLKDEFSAAFQRYAGEIAGTGVYTAGDTDFSAFLSAVNSSDAEVIYAPVSPETAYRISEQARALGMEDIPLLGSDGWDFPELDPSVMNQASAFTTQFTPLNPGKVTQKFVDRYKKKYGTNPDTAAALAYDATNMLLESIRQAGADDPAAVKDRLAALTWDGVSGKMNFDPWHNPIKTVSVVEIAHNTLAYGEGILPEVSCDSPDAYCVGLVTDTGGIHDQGFNQNAWLGAIRAANTLGVGIDFRESLTADDYLPHMAGFANADFDAVLSVGFTMSETTAQAAEAYPGTHFIGVDQDVSAAPLPNLTGLLFPEDQSGFLVGSLAALMSETGSVGAVCGPDAVPGVWRFCEGYRAGARYINPDIEIGVVYHNVNFGQAFSDHLWGQQTAHWLVDNGAGAIFGAGGSTGFGALQGAADRGVYAIGVDFDPYNAFPALRPFLLSSALKTVDSGVTELIRLAQKGGIGAGNFTWRADYAPFHDLDGAVSATVKTQMENIRAALWAGTLTTGVQPAKPNIQVAVMAPMTGDLSSYGESIQQGADIAIAEIEAAGGVLGFEIETVIRDTGCNGAAAVDAGREIMNQGVHYIVGEVCSGASIPLADSVNPKRVLMISPTASNSQLTQNEDGSVKDYIFRAIAIDPFQGDAAARFAYNQGWTSAFILYENGSTFQQGIADAFDVAYTALGGTVTAVETFEPDQTDFTSLLTQLKNQGAEVLFLPAVADQVNAIRQQADALQVTAVFLGGDGWETGNLNLNQLEGSYYISHFSPDNPTPSIQAFVSTYNNLYGVDPDGIAALGYDAMTLLLHSIQSAGYDNPDMVKDALAGVTYQGATGSLVFDALHNPAKTMAVIRIQGGETSFYASVEP